MATISMDFFSVSLCQLTGVKIVLPNDLQPEMYEGNPHFQRPAKMLILLHGFSGTNTDWLLHSGICKLAEKYNLAVICPCGYNSFYLDGPQTGRKFGTFIGKELVEYVSRTFGLSSKREDVFIGGFSMGGFGAIHTALACPDQFSKVLSFSSALIQHNVEKMTPGFEDSHANYDYYRLVFGEPEKLSTSPNNPDYLVTQLKKQGKPLPEIFMCIGTEDFLYGENQLFRQFLTEQNAPFQYHEAPGAHDFNTVGVFLEQALKFLVEDEE